MKYVTFTRESNDFTDILADPNIKKYLRTKIFWNMHLQVGISQIEEKLLSYLELKYGDDITPTVCRDFSPIPYVDYFPKKPESYIG